MELLFSSSAVKVVFTLSISASAAAPSSPIPELFKFRVLMVVSFLRYSANTAAPSSHRLLDAKESISSALLLSSASHSAATPAAPIPFAPKSMQVATSLNASASLMYCAPSSPKLRP
jgi:hypothetical protein